MPPEGTTNLIHTTSSAEYLVTEIKRHKAVALVALAVLLLASVGFGIWYFKHRSAPAAQIESIAVMPFVNESGNADVEYLSDGMTESLINRLSQIPNLSVKARNTVFRYKGKDANTAAKELNVQAVLTGRVVQRGDELTLFLELIDAATENQIWGKQYNRKMTNIVTLQNEIARDVSDNLQTKLSGADEQKLAKRYTENSEAYQLYLRGRFHWNKRLPNEHRKAIEYFGQAVAVDPNYALGYAGIADAYTILWNQGGGSREMMPKAKEAALKAISLDDGLAEGHSALGYILTTYDLDFAAAEREFKRAIELNPNYAPAHQQYGRLLSDQTRHEEALTEMRRALEIDPLSLPINWSYGIDLFYARKYDEAIAQLKKTQELHPDFPRTHSWLARIYHLQGRYAECVEAWAKNHELEGKPEIAAFLRESFARDGWEGFMQATINRQMFEYILLANFYAALGEKDKSFAELNKAYENRSNQLHLLKVDPRLDPLRDDPRFQELLRRVGLSP
jgi:TolB-like protein/lipoprotein NlpI